MSDIFFRGIEALAEFTEFLEKRALAIEVAFVEAGKVASDVLYENAMGDIGNSSKLAPLAQSTQDERVRLGYTPNDPLKRDGTLLANNIEKEHGPGVGAIGSAQEVQKAHELGYINVRTGTSVPPRPVFRLALEEASPAIGAISSAIAKAGLSSGPVTITKSIL